MTTLLDLVDQLDLAVVRAGGVVPDGEIERAAQTARNARLRRGFMGDELVIALAGGTGSGKSSVLNAIAGEEIASVSAIRPHTDHPLAWMPESPGPALLALLDDLEITRRVTHESLPGTVLVDLPDMDSAVSQHRRAVEELLPRVDAVMWVFDPNKYGDPVVHDMFLAPSRAYGDQFVFVLNQADTVPSEDVPLLRSHLTALLAEDGFSAPDVHVTAAAPDVGEPQGIADLRSLLGHRLDAKRIVIGKLVEDVRRSAMRLAASARLWTSIDAIRRRSALTDERVGPVVAQRVREAGDPAEVEQALWDRAYLGATVVRIGVSCTALRRRLDEEVSSDL